MVLSPNEDSEKTVACILVFWNVWMYYLIFGHVCVLCRCGYRIYRRMAHRLVSLLLASSHVPPQALTKLSRATQSALELLSEEAIDATVGR